MHRWPSRSPALCQKKHIVGKILTQRMERHNLNLWTYINWLTRETVCFSCSIEVGERFLKIERRQIL
ncbi:IS1 family transposase [Brenneria corticis]|uniref:Uncharacterized protein n=1 Tax=Brenneria corticis TaxID=2173106 RepID=A0A2U1UDC4_9GAMM|nr:hypothetical protein DDT56_01190 [Brenneria sp. CFCC 11842]